MLGDLSLVTYDIDVIQTPMAKLVGMLAVVQVFKVEGSNHNCGKQIFFLRVVQGQVKGRESHLVLVLQAFIYQRGPYNNNMADSSAGLTVTPPCDWLKRENNN